MPSLRFPILVWRDFQGQHTGCIVEEQHIAAVGDSPADAAGKLKEYLQWRHRTYPWWPGPALCEPQLLTVKVEVRPEYKVEQRTYPCQEAMPLRVPCVAGKDTTGMLVCALPTLGTLFTYYDARALKGLVIHTVQRMLDGLTPQQLSRHLMPPEVLLDDLVIQVPRVMKEKPEKVELPATTGVADPVGAREFRSRFSRPWEREEIVNQLVQTLRNERASVILVGESGAGKTAILVDAIRKVERDPARPETPEGEEPADDPSATPKNRFYSTSASRLISGMRYLGQWEERCEGIIAELSGIDGVLCVENLLDLVRTGGQASGSGIAAFLASYIQRRELRLIAEATPAELDACRRLLPGFAELFQVIMVPPMSARQATSCLERIAAAQAQNLRIEPERGVVDVVYRLFSRFMPYQSFPGPPATFLINAFDRALREKRPAVTADLVLQRFIEQTGLPALFLRDDLPLRHAEVAAELRRSVIGQDSACADAAGVITTLKAGLNDPGRPVGVLLFAGPTGVGKTELARAISRFLFGHGEQRDRLVRLDMSEYAGPGSAQRLLSDPDGSPSALIKRLRQQPFCVLLLDEIEKADAEVFDLLLGVFDEGRLTDPYGRLTTFRSAVIIMTSNLGAEQGEPFGLSRRAPSAYESAIAGFFRPEFFNRIDAVVTFRPLDRPTILAITAKELAELSQREGLVRHGLTLEWTDRLVAHLADTGFDPRYGARPLQRTIESRVVALLARWLLARPGLAGRRIRVDVGDDGEVVIGEGL